VTDRSTSRGSGETFPVQRNVTHETPAHGGARVLERGGRRAQRGTRKHFGFAKPIEQIGDLPPRLTASYRANTPAVATTHRIHPSDQGRRREGFGLRASPGQARRQISRWKGPDLPRFGRGAGFRTAVARPAQRVERCPSCSACALPAPRACWNSSWRTAPTWLHQSPTGAMVLRTVH
jgi:hypothetical protein